MEIDSAGIATAPGARGGDTEERSRSLYPGRVTVTPHKDQDGHYLTVNANRVSVESLALWLAPVAPRTFFVATPLSSGDERAPDDRGAMSAPCPILGFTVLVDLHESVGEPQGEELTRALTELLATHGLAASGGGRRQLLFVVGREGSQATEADRALVESWASAWSSIAAITVSDLVDLSPAS